jgi:hypothetical protein
MPFQPSATASDARHYSDSRGVDWRVHELVRDKWQRVLLFESDTSFRCVRVYPRNWRALEPEALEYLSWHGTLIPGLSSFQSREWSSGAPVDAGDADMMQQVHRDAEASSPCRGRHQAANDDLGSSAR